MPQIGASFVYQSATPSAIGTLYYLLDRDDNRWCIDAKAFQPSDKKETAHMSVPPLTFEQYFGKPEGKITVDDAIDLWEDFSFSVFPIKGTDRYYYYDFGGNKVTLTREEVISQGIEMHKAEGALG